MVKGKKNGSTTVTANYLGWEKGQVYRCIPQFEGRFRVLENKGAGGDKKTGFSNTGVN